MTDRRKPSWAVVHHSTPEGGFVVRPLINGHLPQPYTNVTAVRIYKIRSAAETLASKLNRTDEKRS